MNNIASPENSSVDSSEKELALLIAVVCTTVSLIPTAWVSYISNSIVLLADFLRCAVECAAIFFSWLVIRYTSRSDRTFYDYGFAKLERIAGLAVSGSMFISFFIVAFSAVDRLVTPEPLENTAAGFGLAVLSIFGNVFLWQRNKALAKKSISPVLESQWKLFRAKTFASLIVTLTLSLDLLFPHRSFSLFIDPCGSLFIAAFLFYSAAGLLSDSVGDLIDRSVDESVRLSMLKVLVKNEASYRGFSSIRARRAGGSIFIEIVLEFENTLTLGEVSALCSSLKEELLKTSPDSHITIIPTAAKS